MRKKNNDTQPIKIESVPDYAKDYKYVVYTKDVHEEHGEWVAVFYFWGAYNSLEQAVEVAKVIDGMVTDSWEKA